MKYPDVIRDQPEKSSQLNCTSGPPGEEDVNACRVSPRHIVLTDEDPQKLAEEINVAAATVTATVTATATTVTAVAANTTTTETTATATTAAVTTAASNNNANPPLNVRAHPRKTKP